MNIATDFQVVYPVNEVTPYHMRIKDEEKPGMDCSALLNRSLKRFFMDALRVSLRNPAQAYSFFRTVRNQMRSAAVRARNEKSGLHVPPIIIYSITNRCNLHCKGCYHQALRKFPEPELSDTEMRRVVADARELGVSFMVLAGGEPLVRQNIVDITGEFRDIIFFMFTNGLMIDDAMIARFKKQRNVIPIISLEGYEQETDARRGKGVYRHLQATVRKLKKANIFFGTSVTMTSENFNEVTDERYVKEMIKEGSKLFFFAEYTAIREGTEDWELTESQRDRVGGLVNSLRQHNRALFVAVPGDEDQFGGCLAAGRGFVHISAEGNVEACVFAPFSDCNLKDVPLREALQSKMLQAIRENGDQLVEGKGGCALWDKREWVKSLVPQADAAENTNVVKEPEKQLVVR